MVPMTVPGGFTAGRPPVGPESSPSIGLPFGKRPCQRRRQCQLRRRHRRRRWVVMPSSLSLALLLSLLHLLLLLLLLGCVPSKVVMVMAVWVPRVAIEALPTTPHKTRFWIQSLQLGRAATTKTTVATTAAAASTATATASAAATFGRTSSSSAASCDFGDVLLGTTLSGPVPPNQHQEQQQQQQQQQHEQRYEHQQQYQHRIKDVYGRRGGFVRHLTSALPVRCLLPSLWQEVQRAFFSPPIAMTKRTTTTKANNKSTTMTMTATMTAKTTADHHRRRSDQDHGDVLLATASAWKTGTTSPKQQQQQPTGIQQTRQDRSRISTLGSGKCSSALEITHSRLGALRYCEQPYRDEVTGRQTSPPTTTTATATATESSASTSDRVNSYGDVLLATASSWRNGKDGPERHEEHTIVDSRRGDSLSDTTYYGDVLLATASSWIGTSNAIPRPRTARTARQSSRPHVSSPSLSTRNAFDDDDHGADRSLLIHGDVLLATSFPQSVPDDGGRRRSRRHNINSNTSGNNRHMGSVSPSYGDVLLATASHWHQANGHERERQHEHGNGGPNDVQSNEDHTVGFYGDLLLATSMDTTTTSSLSSMSSTWKQPPRGGGGVDVEPPRRSALSTIVPPPVSETFNAIGRTVRDGVVRFNAALADGTKSLLIQVGRGHGKVAFGGLVVLGGAACVGAYVQWVHMPRFIRYLEWDAQELVPDALLEYRRSTTEDSAGPRPLRSSFLPLSRGAGNQSRQSPVDILYRAVNEAKAKQVEALCRRYRPELWKEYEKELLALSSSSSSSSSPKDGNDRILLKDNPALLKKLTKELFYKKFPALMRPDYVFGLGRDKIDMSVLGGVSGSGGKRMVLPHLLEAVTADLEATCPVQYPDIWERFQSKLLLGQTLADRHDIVFRMVRAIQNQKKKEERRPADVGTETDSAGASSSGGITDSDERQEVVETALG